MIPLRTIDDLDVEGRTVLVRSDFNVPIEDGQVEDDHRIEAAIPTLRELRRRGARVIVASHLGRPDGADPSYSLRPVTERLAALADFPVAFAADVAGPESQRTIEASPDSVIVLENTRFEAGEAANDRDLAERFAALADVFVMDAFGSAHRAHASTAGVASLLPSAAGPLVVAEVEALRHVIEEPERPFVVVLGGAKVSDKIGVIKALLPRVDVMLVGGAMCFTILAAEGYDVGRSLVERDRIGEVRQVLGSAHGGRLTLPTDIVVGDRFEADTEPRVVPSTAIPEDAIGLDIGPDSAQRFASIVGGADTIFWNGPMGVFEWDAFASGTRTVAEAVAASDGYTVAGGGDSVAALRMLGLSEAVTHLSTGGGAALEFIEEKALPALTPLRRQDDA